MDPEAEKPGNHWATLIAVALGLSIAAFSQGLTGQQRIVAGVFAASVVLWASEALPLAVTALAGTAALVAFGGLGAKEAFGAYGDPVILLFVGSFLIARSMENSGLDRRAAIWLLSKPWATKTASRCVFWLGALACVISLLVSNTATTAMLLPITLTILRSMKADQAGQPLAVSTMLMLTWGSSIAVGTIIGTPPNVIGVGLIREATGVSVNFVQWAMFGMPITLVLLLLAHLVLRGRAKGDTAGVSTWAMSERGQSGPLSGPEKVTLMGLGVAMTLWVVPGVVEYATGMGSPTAKLWAARVPEAVAALAGALVLFIVPCRGTVGNRAMTWREAVQIDWGTILLFAGGLALGKAAFDSGLAKVVGTSVAGVLGAHDVWSITAVSAALALVVSELASNTASATAVVPVAVALAEGAGVSPVAPALGAALASNLGFMLPISTPPNAIVYSTRLVPSKTMMLYGLVFDLIGFMVTLGVLRLVLPPMGLA